MNQVLCLQVPLSLFRFQLQLTKHQFKSHLQEVLTSQNWVRCPSSGISWFSHLVSQLLMYLFLTSLEESDYFQCLAPFLAQNGSVNVYGIN